MVHTTLFTCAAFNLQSFEKMVMCDIKQFGQVRAILGVELRIHTRSADVYYLYLYNNISSYMFYSRLKEVRNRPTFCCILV